MIDVKIDTGIIHRFEVSGLSRIIVGEIGCLIGRIYAQTKAIDPKAAEQLRENIRISLLPDSPVWSAPPFKGDSVVSAVIPWTKRAEGPGR